MYYILKIKILGFWPSIVYRISTLLNAEFEFLNLNGFAFFTNNSFFSSFCLANWLLKILSLLLVFVMAQWNHWLVSQVPAAPPQPGLLMGNFRNTDHYFPKPQVPLP